MVFYYIINCLGAEVFLSTNDIHASKPEKRVPLTTGEQLLFCTMSLLCVIILYIKHVLQALGISFILVPLFL